MSTAASVFDLPGEAALLVVWENRDPSDTDHWIKLWLQTDEAPTELPLCSQLGYTG